MPMRKIVIRKSMSSIPNIVCILKGGGHDTHSFIIVIVHNKQYSFYVFLVSIHCISRTFTSLLVVWFVWYIFQGLSKNLYHNE